MWSKDSKFYKLTYFDRACLNQPDCHGRAGAKGRQAAVGFFTPTFSGFKIPKKFPNLCIAGFRGWFVNGFLMFTKLFESIVNVSIAVFFRPKWDITFFKISNLINR